MTGSPQTATFARVIELRGHIIDSGIFSRILGVLTDDERARYTIDEFHVGTQKDEPSYARLTVQGQDAAHLEDLLDKLRELGASVVADVDASLEPAPRDGVLPEDFYATTNLDTEVRIDGAWRPVALPEMDCGIVVDGDPRADRRPVGREGRRSRRRRPWRDPRPSAGAAAAQSALRIHVEPGLERKAQRSR